MGFRILPTVNDVMATRIAYQVLVVDGSDGPVSERWIVSHVPYPDVISWTDASQACRIYLL